MTNEPIKIFKTSLFGGFDRRDVIDYIKSLSSERNTYKKELFDTRAALEKSTRALEEQRAELDETRAICAAAVANANAMADEVIAAVRREAEERIIRAEIETENMRRDLLTFKVRALKDASEKLLDLENNIAVLRASLENE